MSAVEAEQELCREDRVREPSTPRVDSPQAYPQKRPSKAAVPARARVAEDCDAQGRREARPRSAAEAPDQLVALAFAQSPDRLRRRNPALGEAPRRLSGPDLRQRQQEVIDLRRPCRHRWIGDDLLDPRPSQGELPLQPCPVASDLIRVPQRPHALIERSPGSRIARLTRHARILGDSHQPTPVAGAPRHRRNGVDREPRGAPSQPESLRAVSGLRRI